MGAFSSWELQRLFRAYTGDTIGNYIRGRRLSLALQQLMQTPRMRILDVAIEFQFGSQEAFTRAFKNQFNITPGQLKDLKHKTFSAVKPQLNPSRLDHIAKSVSKNPEIKTISGMKLVGLPIVLESTLGCEKESYETVQRHWRSVLRQITENPHQVYGLIAGSDPTMNDEHLSYIAAIEQGPTLPEGFQIYDLKEQRYAIFEVKGPPQSCHIVADYIYGIWLPQSGFKRADGYDFEVFSCDNQTDIAENALRYHIPIIDLAFT